MKTSKQLTGFLLCLAFLIVLFYGLESHKRVNLLERELNGLWDNYMSLSGECIYLESKTEDDKKVLYEEMNMWVEMVKGLQKDNKELREQLDRKMDLPLPDKSDKNSRGGERLVKRTMHVTAFWEGSCDKSPDDPEYGITASGEYVREWHTIAAGPELPMGTMVYIPYFADRPNKGVFVVKDRGGAIDNGDLDIYMTTAKAAFKHGDPNLDVYILGGEK